MAAAAPPMSSYTTEFFSAYVEPNMTIEQLQQLACDSGLKACISYTAHTQLVRNIQQQRGSEPCFLTEKRYACREVCEWSQDCRKLKAHWMR